MLMPVGDGACAPSFAGKMNLQQHFIN